MKNTCVVVGTDKVKKRMRHIRNLMLATTLFTLCSGMQVCASNGAQIIANGFDPTYEILAAVVSSIGQLFLLWGLFEWAQSLNTQDGGAQSQSFKRVASGLIAVLAPQLVPIITASMGVLSGTA